MNDYYELLQVHPRADAAVIRAAYEQLITRYDPALVADAAAELQELAARRRNEITEAFAVLSDPTRRADYDRRRAEAAAAAPVQPINSTALPRIARDGDDTVVPDYRPLPPAGRRERDADFVAMPALAHGRRRPTAAAPGTMPTWVLPALVVAFATFSIVLATLLFSVLNQPATPQAALATATSAAPTPTLDEILQQFDAQVSAAQQLTQQVPDNTNAWIELGHALYDSVVVLRERVATSGPFVQGLYVERLPRWIEAADAYRRALELQDDAVIRADLAMSLCYYGKDANDAPSINEGLSAAEQAFNAAPQEPRVRLGYGLCLAFSDPSRVAEAIAQWQAIAEMPDVPTGIQLQAEQLISEYQQ